MRNTALRVVWVLGGVLCGAIASPLAAEIRYSLRAPDAMGVGQHDALLVLVEADEPVDALEFELALEPSVISMQDLRLRSSLVAGGFVDLVVDFDAPAGVARVWIVFSRPVAFPEPNWLVSIPIQVVRDEALRDSWTTLVLRDGNAKTADTERRLRILAGSAYYPGDANGSGTLDMVDAIVILAYLYLQGESPWCLHPADWDDDGRLTISDPIAILVQMFIGGVGLPDSTAALLGAYGCIAHDDRSCPPRLSMGSCS